jgi:Protein of unknown function (DUF1759)
VLNEIKHLDLIGENYQVVLDILLKNHDQPIVIATNLMDRLFSDSKQIQKIYDSMFEAMNIVNETCLAIDKLGPEYQKRDTWIANMLYSRFSSTLKNQHFISTP